MMILLKKQPKKYHCFVLISILLLLTTVTRSRCSTDVRFSKSSICDVDARVSNGCSTKREDHGRGIISCTVKCARDKLCIGASLDLNGACFTHNECPHLDGCDTEATDHHYVTRNCSNGGVWDPVLSQCQCVDTWLGPTCEDYPTTCNGLISTGISGSVYKTSLDIYGDGSYIILVFCQLHPTWAETIALINAGEQDFNRTWAEYRQGFYLDDSHFWIGLDHMYAMHKLNLLNAMTSEVFFYDGSKANLRINSVVLSDLPQAYSLTYGTTQIYHFNAKGYALSNCWSGLMNKPFSTWDKDEDEDLIENCASNSGSGWWYAGCNPPCNLMGWSLGHSDSKPPSSIMKLAGIDMEVEKDNIRVIQIGFH